MRLAAIVLALGVSSCAGYLKSYDIGCHPKNGMNMCTDNAGVTYFSKSTEERTACGIRELHPTYYVAIVDEGCDGTADTYQEGDNDRVIDYAFREDNEERFLEYDERLRRAKEKWD